MHFHCHQGGLRRECGVAEGCTCDFWSPSPAPATLAPSPHPLRALDETLPSVLRSNPLYSEEEEQEIVIIVESLDDQGGEVDAAPQPPRRAPSTSSGYGSGGGSNGRSSPHLPKTISGPALLAEKNEGSHTSDSDGSPDCTLSRSLRDDIKSCLGGCKWEKDVDHVVEAAVKGAGSLTAAKARLHAALLALQTQPIPSRASIPSLPYCGPGVRPGDVTMMPKNSEISLLAASALFTLDGATSEALSRRLARHERRRRRCRAALSIAMVLLLVAAVGAIELFLSRGRRLFGNVLR